jgi:hypothetical protein
METNKMNENKVTAEQILQRYVQENAELRFELIKLQMLIENGEKAAESDEH